MAKTIKVFCEGKTEELFFKYLIKLFELRGQAFNHRNCRGISFASQLKKIQDEHISFDEIVYLTDGDNFKQKLWDNFDVKIKTKIKLFVVGRPCFEGICFDILKLKPISKDGMKNKLEEMYQTDRNLDKLLESVFSSVDAFQVFLKNKNNAKLENYKAVEDIKNYLENIKSSLI